MGHHASMRVLLISALVAVGAASSWTFDDASLSIRSKGAGIESGPGEKLSTKGPLTSKAIELGTTDALKITLTTKDGSSGKKPDQAFLSLQDAATGLEDSFPLTVKENGKAKVDIAHKDIPLALLAKGRPLKASIIIGSFGSSTPYKQHVFDLAPTFDTSSAVPKVQSPERLAQKEEIHHIFRADPKSAPRIVSLVFTLAVLGALPVLLGVWLFLGANGEHVSAAFGQNPMAHSLFFGSILAIEAVFFMYYTHWNLFQTLPVAAVVGLVAFVSGSRALTEVQERRLAGKR